MDIAYRRGEKEDCKKIAEMVNIASDGVLDYLFHDLVPGMTPLQLLAHNLGKDHYPHTYKSVVVACDDNNIVGAALSYPSSYHKITDGLKNFLPAERLEQFRDYYESRVENSWFLDAMGVAASHRKRGIGERLISLTKEKAVKNGYQSLSLIVLTDNVVAIPLYQRCGFEVVKNINVQRNEFIKHDGGCFLMQCDIRP